MKNQPSMRKIFIAISGMLLLIGLFSCQGQENRKVTFKARLVKPPVATLQLEPAIFVNEKIIKRLNITEGFPVVVTINNISAELRLYKHLQKQAVFALHKNFRQHFHVHLGETYPISLTKISANQATVKAKPIGFFVENYHGKTQQWPHVAIGAPHGDCDRETGTVVHLLQEQFGIPATAAYGARLSYRGIWFDANRPLRKLPKPGGGVFPERVWDAEAEHVYQTYQDSVWQNSGLHFGQRFKFFCSFHGHDLTVKLPDGKVIERPVMEAMGIGFSKDDLRKIKAFYDSTKQRYFKNPPMLVFGNLPEDRVYYYENIPLTFFYSGLGTRLYGSLRSDLIEYGLHIETPNTMRIKPEVQGKTAQFLHDLYRFVLQEIISHKQKITLNNLKVTFNKLYQPQMTIIPGGLFLMGAPHGFGWSSERPQHRVRVSSFKMDRYEVTNGQFARFLNEALQNKKIQIEKGVVKNATHPQEIWFRTVEAAPMSEISFMHDRFKAIEGRENFPVIYVSWFGAEAFARAHGKRLPTEAEWEMAASWDFKNHQKFLYAYQSDKPEASKTNFQDSGDPWEDYQGAATVPVNFYSTSSPSGIFGMSGNVMEWCADYYQYYYYKSKTDEILQNPQGPATGTMRTVRGGAWNLEPWVGRTTFRIGIGPNATLVNVGFRCVKSLAR